MVLDIGEYTYFKTSESFTHHQPTHGEQNTEESFQCPQTVLGAGLSLKSEKEKANGNAPTLKSGEKKKFIYNENTSWLFHERTILQFGHLLVKKKKVTSLKQ